MKALSVIIALILHLGCRAGYAQNGWQSETIKSEVTTEFFGSAHISDRPIPLVVYLKNLSIKRIGTEPDDVIIADLRTSGAAVLTIDYRRHPDANGARLCADVLKLRSDLTDSKKKSLLRDENIDASRVFIIPEGFRLTRDVPFARDGDRVLAMDIVHPSRPASPVPLLLEFSCDNKDRMGSFSLLYCRDALLEGGTFAGFATAMADHPVAPPYKGLDDPMPQVIHRLKAAVRTARAQSEELKLSGKIGVIGFSRAGPMAAILACTNGREDLHGAGAHADGSADVQAALIHGNRYDYLDLRSDDPMLTRFEKAWGKQSENQDAWAVHGASHYLTRSAAPMFLNTSDAESPEYRDGLAKFAARLDAMKVPHVYQLDHDGRGHQVSTHPGTLSRIYEFFHQHLKKAD